MLIAENIKNKLAIGEEEGTLLHEISNLIPNTTDVDTLILAFKIAIQDAERNGINTLSYIALIPKWIRKYVTPEFAHEFRKKYNAEVLGLTQEELPDVDYGYKEIEPDIIDISNKDCNEVLAALYNASTPIGAGFFKYNPMPWTKEIAAWYLETQCKVEDDKSIRLGYVYGRPLHITFKNNLVYARVYNDENEPGLAQRAIATCQNIEKRETIHK